MSSYPPSPSEPKSILFPVMVLLLGAMAFVGFNISKTKAHKEAPAPMQSVEIVTVPTGAKVLVDGASIGNSPVTLTRDSLKDLNVVAKLAGHVDLKQTLSDGQKEVALTLRPKPYVLSVKSPEGSKVTVDGKILSSSSLELDAAPTKAIPVEFFQKGFVTISKSVGPTDFVESDKNMTAVLSVSQLDKNPVRRRVKRATPTTPSSDLPPNPF